MSHVAHDLADTLRRVHGVDVSDVLINRGSDAGPRARAVGARAFTSDGEIVLPLEAGPLQRPSTRALLAHELTHAAQQRALGPNLPPEDSGRGAALEDAAIAVERRVLGQGPRGIAPPEQHGGQPLFHAPPRPVPAWPVAAAAGPRQRQTDELPSGPSATDVFDPFGLLPQQATTQVSDLVSDGLPGLPPTDPAGVAPDFELGPARARLLELAEQRLLDLNDPIALGELADGIYKRIRGRLQRELLIDRERSGLLSDFR